MASDAKTQDKAPTPQEVLLSLERTATERIRTLNDLKDQLTKIQDQVIAAQDAAFKAFQGLAVAKEQYLVSIIADQQNKLKTAEAAQAQAAQQIKPPVVEPRPDNLAPPTITEIPTGQTYL
jgi:3-methyladenine DNA glycosylase/8-oxoguanine DNA glycosylase